MVSEIGRGRFGVVYKAWWVKDAPRIVALKILSGASAMEINRFDREIAVLRKIDSPHIVKCLDAGVTGESHYFVMDYVLGTHLDEYLNDRTESLSEKLAVFERVCNAVADAHARGVVHRDLKPRNILVNDRGEPHILDFGICSVDHDCGTSWDKMTITRHGDVIGTLKYMSPEQAWGGVAGPVDERSDLWSLGIILYEIVTDGDYPYSLRGTPDKPPHEALLDSIRRELPQLPKLNHLPRGKQLETLIERCLTWEPANRMASARALADDVKRYLAEKRIKTRPLGVFYRVKRLAVGAAARSRWSFAAVFVAMVGMTLWVSTFLFSVSWRVTESPFATASDSAASGASGRVDDGIVIVGLGDQTIPAVVEYAAQHGLTGVTKSVPTWRGVHAHIHQRLIAARPKAVVWDYYFRSPRKADESFAASILALENAGIPVVIAASAYDTEGQPDLSPTICRKLGRRLRHGAIVARDMVKRPGEFIIAFQPKPGVVVPSLALSTLAAVLHPDTRLDLDWPSRDGPIHLLYEFEPGAYLRGRDFLHPTKSFEAGSRQRQLRPTDLLATLSVELSDASDWEARTITYESLLTGSREEIETRVRGKIVLFGDMRKRRFGFQADRFPVKYGTKVVEDVPGSYLQADAVASLLDGRYHRAAFPLAPATFLTMLVLATIGCLLPIRLATTRVVTSATFRRLAWSGMSLMGIVSFAGMIGTGHVLTVHAGMAGFSLALPMMGSLWVELARNRHRVLERNRRAIEGFGLDSDGTMTVAPRRR
ncbi:MAG: protein kinase [Planctomycetes bacterium]|nr:protein kinase [Planctomycetota bacterium]